ncbi:MAG TPA: TolC family protein [Planctomycetota bacterium]|jgi:cobalt-zinc-cadmium efflux system outer membrane protein
MRQGALKGAVICVLMLAGCTRYEPKPISPQDILARVELARRGEVGRASLPASEGDKAGMEARPTAPFTFVRAAELMQAHSPALQEARAEYETALATAKVKTPLPNPSVEAGPNYSFGADVTKQRWAPFASIGFAIPTGSRIKRQDELNRVRAEQAQAEIAIKIRELYLQLRKEYSQLTLARARIALRKSIAESGNRTLDLNKRLIEAGTINSLDVGLLRLETVRLQSEVLSAQTESVEAEGTLAELIGVQASLFVSLPEQSLPTLPEKIPPAEELRQQMLAYHPQLARQRVAYEVAERELRLEIAKQYPDFRFGPSYDRETNEAKNTLGLTLGIDLPVFDRNQQAIATAAKKREEVRAKYEAAANRALSQLETTLRTVDLNAQRLALLKNNLEPQARQNTELARKTIESGASDTLRLLETERSQRTAAIDVLETELALRQTWVALEQAVGAAILQFPGEKPDALKTPDDQTPDHQTPSPEHKP